MRQSLLDNQQNPQNVNEEEEFNNMVKETIVASKKEYDDIDRKRNEEEIARIKNDPAALNKKIKNIFSSNNAFKNTKKLPPLEFVGKGKGLNPLKKDLESLKAPILNNQSQQLDLNKGDAHGTLLSMPNSTSEVDINEDTHFQGNVSKPSYNPNLLRDEKNKNKENLISLESKEFKHSELKQYAQDEFNKSKGKAHELNALIHELNDEAPMKYQRKKEPSRQIEHNETTIDHPKPEEKLISNDSFDDLMDEFDPNEKEDKPPGMAQIEFVNKQTQEDEFEF